MTRIPRFLLVLCVTATLALVSVPFAGARPLETSPAVDRTEGGWFGAALRWLEELAGLHFSAPDRHHRATEPRSSSQKDGGVNTPMGGSCIDPHGGQGCG